MSTLKNIQQIFLLVFLISISASLQASPLLVVANKSIAVEAVTPKPPNKFQTWKQKWTQKMVDRKIKKLKKEIKNTREDTTSTKTHPLANVTLGLGIVQIGLVLVAALNFYWFGIISIAAMLIPLIGILNLIFGLIAKKQIKKNPQKFTGRKRTHHGMWLGLGIAMLLILALYGIIAADWQV